LASDLRQIISVLNRNASGTTATLKIFNSLGELVNQFSIPESNQASAISLSSLPNGIYFAQFSEQSQLLTKKIILQ